MIITAGGIVSKKIHNELYFLIIKKVVKEYIYWEFPKGKLEEGEDLSDCATREISEETGIYCVPKTLISKIKGKKKIIYLFDMRIVKEGLFIPSAVIKECKWVTYPNLKKYVNQKLYKSFINKDLKKYYSV